MLAVARAKLNLFLAVGERRANGFHDVDTVMTAIDRADLLDVSLAPRPRLDVQSEDLPAGQEIPVGPENLVWRAAQLALGADGGWRVTLYKTIPAGFGLGGGSADAAATLQALAALARQDKALAPLAAALGSDVPFFLRGGLCRVRGRGERVAPLGALPTLHVVVAVPGVPVATALAYSWLDAAPERPRRRIDGFLAALEAGDPRRIAMAVWNDFEPVVGERVPEVARVRERLLERGAWSAALCGSGSGVFGVFGSPEEGTEAAFALRREGLWAVYAPTTARATELGRDPTASGAGVVG